MKFIGILLSIIAMILAAYPIWYGLQHWADASFRDAAVAGWFGTVLGAIVGIPIALQLSRWQEVNQQRTAAALSSREFAQEARVIRERMFEEIQFNINAIEQLQTVVARPRSARADIWTWAGTVVDSFEFSARRDYEKVAFRTRSTRLEDETFFVAYRDLNRLKHSVRQATAAHSFFLGYAGDQNQADALLAQIRSDIAKVADQLNRALKKLTEWIR